MGLKGRAVPGPHTPLLGPSWKDISWQEEAVGWLHTASWSPEVASDPAEVPDGPPSWEKSPLCWTPRPSRLHCPAQNLPCFSRSMW